MPLQSAAVVLTGLMACWSPSIRERGAQPSAKTGSATTNNVGPSGREHWPEYHSFLIAGAIVAIVGTPEFEVVALFVVASA